MLEKYVNWNLNAINKYLYICLFSDFFISLKMNRWKFYKKTEMHITR